MDSASIKHSLATAWERHQKGQRDEAEAAYRHVIAQAPKSPEAWCYLGILLSDRQRFEDAVSAYRRAISFRADFPVAWNNLGNALRMLGKVEEADAAFQTAIDQKPDYISPWKNRGTLWVFESQLERAIDAFRSGLEIQPHAAELHRNLGVIYLLQGNYEDGWPEYAARWHTGTLRRPPLKQPIWDGTNLNGKTIFLYPEQGLGDTIQFVRFTRDLKEQGATVIVEAKPRMIPLLTTCGKVDRFLPRGTAPKQFDVHCSLVEVAQHVNLRDEEKMARYFDSGHGGYLSAATNLVDDWRNWLAANLPSASKERMKVGICWQGNPDHQADVFRSIPLTAFAPLAEREELQLVSLQFGYGEEQLDLVPFSDRVLKLPEAVDRATDTFIDTSAVIKNLDLVISSDTSVAHLAGALGVPVWLGLPFLPDWRWGQSGSTTPWYPTMRLFRQPEKGDWASVFENIVAALGDSFVRLSR